MKKIIIEYNVERDGATALRNVTLNFTETDDGHYNLKIAHDTLNDLIRIGIEQGLQIKE
jgi:hypothetical protein